MHYFIGESSNIISDNHAPISNGRILTWLSQYNKSVHVDIINQLFFPDFNLSNSLLGEEGSFILVKDKNEKIWYDPYGLIKGDYGQIGEIISIDSTQYVNGYGIYEVVSHKGNTVVKTKTWSPFDTNIVVRSIEVSTLKRNRSEASIFPIVNLKSLSERIGNIFISRISCCQWLAVTTIPSLEGQTGDIAQIVSGGKSTIYEHSSIQANLTFNTNVTIPENGFSTPVYQLFAAGKTKEEALKQLHFAINNVNNLYETSLNQWSGYHTVSDRMVNTISSDLKYYWRVSNSLLHMSLQENGAPLLIGFRPYQGNLWVRDGIWIVTTLALAGHLNDAKKGLYSIVSYLKQRPDGNYFFAYNVTTGVPNEHAFENDTTGLLLYGIWQIWHLTKDDTILNNLWPIIEHSSQWIINNRDNSGLVKADAGIWETFGPHLGQPFENMTWTSGISAYGLLKASIMASYLNKPDKSEYYIKIAFDIITAIKNDNVKNNVVVRSKQTLLLDSSVLLFFTEFPILPIELLDTTLKEINNRLKDPYLGGLWRHESLTTEEGDLKPWTGPTFWMGEALLTANQKTLAYNYFCHNYDNSSFCGLLPELMYSLNRARGIAMPSYSQSGVIRSVLYELGLFHR